MRASGTNYERVATTRVYQAANGDRYVEGINGNEMRSAKVTKAIGEPAYAECVCGTKIRLEDEIGSGAHRRLTGLEYAIHITTERCDTAAPERTQ